MKDTKEMLRKIAEAFVRYLIGCAVLTVAGPIATIIFKHTAWKAIVWAWNLF